MPHSAVIFHMLLENLADSLPRITSVLPSHRRESTLHKVIRATVLMKAIDPGVDECRFCRGLSTFDLASNSA